jgi:hypothetical protein
MENGHVIYKLKCQDLHTSSSFKKASCNLANNVTFSASAVSRPAVNTFLALSFESIHLSSITYSQHQESEHNLYILLWCMILLL